MSDITVGAIMSVTTHRTGDHTTITHVFGNSPKGKALLRKWVDSESPPRPDDRGRICIKVYPEDLAEIRHEATLAGLSIESDDKEVSS
jgi:hypothetical protein